MCTTNFCKSLFKNIFQKLFEQLPKIVAISKPEVLMASTHEQTFDDETVQRKSMLLQIRLAFVSATLKEQ